MSERKEHLKRELKELLGILIYLATSFCLLATVKSLILIQLGIHDFVHGYLKALVEALALSKIVLLAQGIPLLDALKRAPLVRSASFQAVVMSVIVFAGSVLEDKLFAKHVAEAPLKQELLVSITHLAALFMVFYALFVARGLSKALGPNVLHKLLFEPPLQVKD